LFTVLPLPIKTSQPVHIHGLFSISPDRARLYQFSGSDSQDRAPAKWNNWLFENAVPMAWTRLLEHIADLHPDISPFEWWPKSVDGDQDFLANAIENFVNIIDKESLPLFPTTIGYVTSNVGMLDTGSESEALIGALRQAKVPIVYIPQRLRNYIKHLFTGRVLSPHTLSTFFKNHGNISEAWKHSTKQVILEYLLSEPGFTDYGSLDIFPFEDESYRSIEDGVAFVHRDEFERKLFTSDKSRNLDLGKVSAVTKSALLKGCGQLGLLHQSIRHRSDGDFRNYCLATVFSPFHAGQDLVVLDTESVKFVSRAWNWIIKQRITNFDVISDLWLLPLTNGYNRKILPSNPSSEATHAPDGEMGDLLREFDARRSSKAPYLLDTRPGRLLPKSQQLIMEVSRREPKYFIKDGGNISHFIQWLSQISEDINVASSDEKDQIVKLVASKLPLQLDRSSSEMIRHSISSLDIFQKVSWKVNGDKWYV
jgi:sacsin